MKKSQYIIYKLYNKHKQIIYIGRSSQGKKRIKTHVKEGIYRKIDWKRKINYYSFCSLNTEADMIVLETYLINRFKPEYNNGDMGEGNLQIEIEDKWHWSHEIFTDPTSVNALNIDINRKRVAQKEAQKEWDGTTDFAKVRKKKIEEYQNYTEKELKKAVNNLP